MDESLKEKSREGLLDSPDSGLPPSPSPPFYSLSPGSGEGRAGGGSSGADPPAQGHRREAKDGKVVRAGEMGEKGRESPGAGGAARTEPGAPPSAAAPSAPPGLRGTAGGFCCAPGWRHRGGTPAEAPESKARSSPPSCGAQRAGTALPGPCRLPPASAPGCAPASRGPPGLPVQPRLLEPPLKREREELVRTGCRREEFVRTGCRRLPGESVWGHGLGKAAGPCPLLGFGA